MLFCLRSFVFLCVFVALPVLAQSATEDAGWSLYLRRCAVCHGAELEGNVYWLGASGSERMVRVPALRHNIWAQAMPDAWLRAIISDGEAHIPVQHSEYVMPDLMLDANEVESLLRYLREVWRSGMP